MRSPTCEMLNLAGRQNGACSSMFSLCSSWWVMTLEAELSVKEVLVELQAIIKMPHGSDRHARLQRLGGAGALPVIESCMSQQQQLGLLPSDHLGIH